MQLGLGLSLSLTGQGGGGAPYLGQVATRGWVKTAFIAGNKQAMTRSFHFARDDIADLRLIFSNWWMKTTTPCAETTPGGDATITASIEYPEGVFTRVTFGAAESVVVPDGQDVMSDPVTVAIPNGAKFWIRNYYTNPAGIVYLGTGSNATVAANRDTCQFGASGVPDQTMGGNFNNSGGNVINPPTLLLAMTRKRSFLLLGDSRTAGVNDVNDAGDKGISARSVSTYGYANLGSPTERATEFVTTGATRRVAYGQYVSDVICGYGINDVMRGSRTKAELVADIQAIRAMYPTKRFYALTLDPETTGSWGDAASQTVRAPEFVRASFNADLKAGLVSGLTAAFDITVAAEDPANPGKWLTPGYTTDGIHESQIAATAIASSGVIAP